MQFDPKFVPPKGTALDLTLYWTDAEGVRHTAPAREWLRTSTDRWYDRELAALPAGLSLPEDLELRYDDGNKDLLWYGRMSEADRDRALGLSADETFRKQVRSMYEESQPKPFTADFVFAGSFFYDKPVQYDADGEVLKTVRTYAAEGGEVVCVANFPAATIDVAERSSADGENVLYEAATELIPPKGTEVQLVFTRRPPPVAPAAASPVASEQETAPKAAAPDAR